jgi:hypothetical protein
VAVIVAGAIERWLMGARTFSETRHERGRERQPLMGNTRLRSFE